MADTIETFVAKLQAEGVEAGRKEADEIRAAAQQQADTVVAEARKEADRIVADAEAEARSLLDRGRTELRLAARDATGLLRQALGRALEAVFARAAREKLEDPDFVGRLLHEIVLSYVKADQESQTSLVINVSDEMRDKLMDWALREISGEDQQKIRGAFDLKGALAEAGFEYTVAGSTAEVTVDSVTETLSQLIGPDLREMIRQAAEEGAKE